jgi:hypothetical protein
VSDSPSIRARFLERQGGFSKPNADLFLEDEKHK